MTHSSVARIGLIGVLAALVPGVARGQDSAQAAPPSTLKVTLDLGLVNAAGNTRFTSFNFGDNIEYKMEGLKFTQFASIVYAHDSAATTAEQYSVGGRVDKQLFSVVHGFIGGTYERNTFAGVNHRLQEFAGLGIVIIDLPTDKLNLDVGAALSQQTSSLAAPDRNFTSLRLAMQFRHDFNKSAYFSQSAEYLPNLTTSTAWQGRSETLLVAPISDMFALKLAYLVKYDNFPEPGFEKSDRLLSSGVQIRF